MNAETRHSCCDDGSTDLDDDADDRDSADWEEMMGGPSDEEIQRRQELATLFDPSDPSDDQMQSTPDVAPANTLAMDRTNPRKKRLRSIALPDTDQDEFIDCYFDGLDF